MKNKIADDNYVYDPIQGRWLMMRRHPLRCRDATMEELDRYFRPFKSETDPL